MSAAKIATDTIGRYGCVTHWRASLVAEPWQWWLEVRIPHLIGSTLVGALFGRLVTDDFGELVLVGALQ